MDKSTPEKEYFFCRKGMKHIGPLSRNTLRRYLAAGLIDAQTLISHNDDGCMLPLGASSAAGEITFTVRAWQRQFSLPVYLVWLCFMPLSSAFFAAWGVYAAGHSWCILLGAIMLAQLGMSYWLWRTWNLLLVDKHPLLALFYALPVALPLVNIFWIWIGYIPLSKYYRQYRSKLDADEPFPYWLYYLAVIFFYLMLVGIGVLSFFDGQASSFFIYAVGCVCWLWFGLTLLSLFVADCFTTRVIQKKLSNLAFGSLQFAADIDYNVLHKTVLSIAFSARRKSRILAFSVLLTSYLCGGWFWLHALKFSLLVNMENSRLMQQECIVCTPGRNLVNFFQTDQSTRVKSNAVRQGK